MPQTRADRWDVGPGTLGSHGGAQGGPGRYHDSDSASDSDDDDLRTPTRAAAENKEQEVCVARFELVKIDIKHRTFFKHTLKHVVCLLFQTFKKIHFHMR